LEIEFGDWGLGTPTKLWGEKNLEECESVAPNETFSEYNID
jgi:hypothetical protein